jgi:predicted O-methyltransferase YrrM
MSLRRFAHWSPRYLFCRAALWLEQKRHPDHPWLAKEAIHILDSWLKKTDRGVEWGAGRSTLWFARRVGQLVSVEHDLEWYNHVSEWLEREGVKNVSLEHRALQATMADSPGPYVAVASDFERESLQFALVDGLLRDECALQIIDKLAPQGLLIVDNVERYLPSDSRSPEAIGANSQPVTENWRVFAGLVKDWRRIWTSNGVMDTCIWVKP